MVGYEVPLKGLTINNFMNRPLCTACKGNLAAINYKIGDKTYYRKICSSCLRKGRRTREMPGWTKTGYKKKIACERCGFIAKLHTQIFVFYLDGNLKNNNWVNLRSVCANCRIELNSNKTTWRESPLIADN